MPEVRERKQSDKIKGKDSGKSGPVKKDVRRQMTAKYVKELTQRQKNRDAGGSTAQAPEVQAVEQVEEMTYTTAGSLRDRTADAVSKSISRHKRKQQKKKGRTEQPPGETSPTGTEAPPPPAGEHPRERPADNMRTRPPEDSRRPAAMRERRPDTVRERPVASRPGSRPGGAVPQRANAADRHQGKAEPADRHPAQTCRSPRPATDQLTGTETGNGPAEAPGAHEAKGQGRGTDPMRKAWARFLSTQPGTSASA